MSDTSSKPDEAAGPVNETSPPAPAKPGKGSRVGAIVVLALIVASLVWYFVSDRLTPYTSQARVQAFVVPVAAEVSGKVLKVHVKNNDEVKPGQPLFDIDPVQYRIALAAQPLGLRVGAPLGQRHHHRGGGGQGRRCRRPRPAASTPSRMRRDSSRSMPRGPGCDLAAPRRERAGQPHQGAQPGGRRRGRPAARARDRGRAGRQERAAAQRPRGDREGRARSQAHAGARACPRHGDRPAHRCRPVRAGRGARR